MVFRDRRPGETILSSYCGSRLWPILKAMAGILGFHYQDPNVSWTSQKIGKVLHHRRNRASEVVNDPLEHPEDPLLTSAQLVYVCCSPRLSKSCTYPRHPVICPQFVRRRG